MSKYNKIIIAFGVIIVIIIFSLLMMKMNEIEMKTSEIENLTVEVTELNKTDDEKSKFANEIIDEIQLLQNSIMLANKNLSKVSKASLDKIQLSTKAQRESMKSEDLSGLIKRNVQAADSIITASRMKIDSLQKKINQYSSKYHALAKTINLLSKLLDQQQVAIKEKEVEIVELKSQVDNLIFKINELSSQIYNQQETITQKNKKLNEVYYIVGEEKDLFNKKVIKYEGGILGLATTPVLESDLPDDLMLKTSVVDLKEILIDKDSRKIRILTSHNQKSYEIVKNGDNKTKILISNPKQFWERSKYLVIIFYQ